MDAICSCLNAQSCTEHRLGELKVLYIANIYIFFKRLPEWSHDKKLNILSNVQIQFLGFFKYHYKEDNASESNTDSETLAEKMNLPCSQSLFAYSPDDSFQECSVVPGTISYSLECNRSVVCIYKNLSCLSQYPTTGNVYTDLTTLLFIEELEIENIINSASMHLHMLTNFNIMIISFSRP